MTNALLLPDWIVADAFIDDDNAYQISAYPKFSPVYCSKCDRKSEFFPIGNKQITCVDAPVHGRQTFVTITQTRYKCGACQGVFWESFGDFDLKRRMAYRCLVYVKHKSFLVPNTHVAEEIGVDESTVRRISKSHADALNEQHKRELRAPRWMGMDETTLAGSLRAVFVNLEDGWPFELLANHKGATIEHFLMNLPGHKDVEVVTMDLFGPYRQIVEAVMPQAAIVADRWHVAKMATEAMIQARLNCQKTVPESVRLELVRCRKLFQVRHKKLSAEQRLSLDGWLKNYDELREPYWLKEAFLSIWDHASREGAKVALDTWRASIPDDLKKLFKKPLNASVEWENEILNFFDHNRLTNATVERRNGELKTIERQGRNSDFETIRNRALFGKQAGRQKTEYVAKLKAWRATNPTCATCNQPFDEAAEESVKKAASHPLSPRSFTIGYKECHACLQAEEDRWTYGSQASIEEMNMRYRAMRALEKAAALSAS